MAALNTIEVQEIAHQRGIPGVNVKTGWGYTHYLSSEGWQGLVKALAWKEMHYGGKTRRIVFEESL